MTEALFSYGTLQQPAVQQATFGRLLSGHPDHLIGFVPARVPIADARLAAVTGRTHHDNAVFTGAAAARVAGTVFEVTHEELEAADDYERTANYVRILVTLGSGRGAFVYVHAPTAPGTPPAC